MLFAKEVIGLSLKFPAGPAFFFLLLLIFLWNYFNNIKVYAYFLSTLLLDYMEQQLVNMKQLLLKGFLLEFNHYYKYLISQASVFNYWTLRSGHHNTFRELGLHLIVREIDGIIGNNWPQPWEKSVMQCNVKNWRV